MYAEGGGCNFPLIPERYVSCVLEEVCADLQPPWLVSQKKKKKSMINILGRMNVYSDSQTVAMETFRR